MSFAVQGTDNARFGSTHYDHSLPPPPPPPASHSPRLPSHFHPPAPTYPRSAYPNTYSHSPMTTPIPSYASEFPSHSHSHSPLLHTSAHPSRAPSPVQPLYTPGGVNNYYPHFEAAASMLSTPLTLDSNRFANNNNHLTLNGGVGGSNGVRTRPATPEPQSATSNGAPPLHTPSASLKVLQWTPQRGEEGTQVTIVLDSAAVRHSRSSVSSASSSAGHHNAASSSSAAVAAQFGPGSPALGNPQPRKLSGGGGSGVYRRFVAVFGQAQAPTKFTRAQQIDGNGVGQSMTAGLNEEDAFVVLTTFVPARKQMGPVGERVLLVVQVVDEEGTTTESCIVGEWDPAIPATPTRIAALKRDGEDLVNDRDAPGLRSPARSIQNSPARPLNDWHSPQIPHHAVAALHSPALSHHPSPSLGHQPAPVALPPGPPQPDLSHQLDDSTTGPPPVASTSHLKQPELIRTSQIHAPKNGYGATYSHKVVLKLSGDLNTMAMGWSNEEWTTRRRLIQFWPQQDGNVINVGFRPIAQSEYVQNSIVISCIFRDEWNECFVTSVDTIYLLEALVGSRFTVEEKNRIRRNLEGFKPMTVSKSKPDAEPFFKLIMGFPNPKPRNIEKDVKVFPWKILASSLKKIMSKYSANYPLGPDGTPLGGPIPSTPQPAEASVAGTPHQTPLQASDARFAQPLSPQFNSPVITHASPHFPHPQPSPHLGHPNNSNGHHASPHIAHASPHLPFSAVASHSLSHSQHTSPYLGAPTSSAHHAPHLVGSNGGHDERSPNPDLRSPGLPHSPHDPQGHYFMQQQRVQQQQLQQSSQHGYGDSLEAYSTAGYGSNGAGGGGGGGSYASPSMQHHEVQHQSQHQQHSQHSQHSHQHQQHQQHQQHHSPNLFPSNEDYGVYQPHQSHQSHQQPHSHHNPQQHQQHAQDRLPPPAPLSVGTTHLRSFSEGVHYSSPNPNSAGGGGAGGGSAYASPVPPQLRGGWGEALEGGGGGGGGGGDGQQHSGEE